MQPEEDLRADHMAIRRGLKLLENLTRHLREGHPVRNTDLFSLIDVLDETTTENHYEKEEDVLFEFVRERGEAFGVDSLGSFKDEHREMDERLAGIRELVEPATGGDQRARQRIDKETDRLAGEMRSHLSEEETTFLDRLHESLTTDEITELGERLEGIDDANRKARVRLEDRVERLEDRYADRW